MRQIAKGKEPASLALHRRKKDSDYDNYLEKSELRDALAAEQRYLCCYCMGRIETDWKKMKIEHWRCQADHDDEQLDYQNLLGGCMGGEGRPHSQQHCDTRKKNKKLKWNPANRAHRVETRIIYDPDGTIRSEDAAFDRELNVVLNLNLPAIKNNRKSSITAMLEWWKRERDRRRKRPPKSMIEFEIKKRLAGEKLIPYSQVAVWFLRRRLAERTT